jgi:hypothetical protein
MSGSHFGSPPSIPISLPARPSTVICNGDRQVTLIQVKTTMPDMDFAAFTAGTSSSPVIKTGVFAKFVTHSANIL